MNKKPPQDDPVFDGFEQSNTTPVPDILFDKLLAELSSSELKVILYIIRRTWGFKKDTDAISLNQFQHGITTKDGKVLDKGCGVRDRKTIVSTLSSLEKKGYIQKEKSKTTSGDDATSTYRIHFKEVVGKTNHLYIEGSGKNQPPRVVGKTNHRSGKNQPPVVGESNPQETVLQETVLQERKNEGGSKPESDSPTLSSTHSSSLIAKDSIENIEHVATRNTSSSCLSDEEQRIQGYWCQLGFTERPSAHEHWRTLSKHIASFEEMDNLFKYTQNAVRDKPNKRVYPGNLVDHLDGWKQDRAPKPEKPKSSKPYVRDLAAEHKKMVAEMQTKIAASGK